MTRISSMVLIGLVLSIGFISLAGCSLRDLRPEQQRSKKFTQQQVTKGRQLLHGVTETYGGDSRWRSRRTMQVEMTDYWPYAIPRALYSPWPDHGEPVRATFLLGSDNSHLEFIKGSKQGQAWAIHNKETFVVDPKGNTTAVEDSTIQFWLPTVEYFYELPFRLPEASVVAHLGQRQQGGKKYDVVFVTWNTAEPQNNIDQFLIWINQSTGLIDIFEYTVREEAGFVAFAGVYSDFVTIDGIVVPKKLTVVDKPGGSLVLHEMVTHRVRFGVPFPRDQKR